MNKTLAIIGLLILISAFFVHSDMEEEIKKTLKNKKKLDEIKSQVNDVLNNLPERTKGAIGKDRVYHVRISGSEAEINLKGGIITTVSSGKPSSPTHYFDSSYGAIEKIVNSENKVLSVVDALFRGEIRITKVPLCKEDIQCEDHQVCTSKGCTDAFTLVVVPLGYSSSDLSKFLSDSRPEIDLVEKYLPLNTDLMRVHYVNPKVCPDSKCVDVCSDCQNTVRDCAKKAGLLGAASKIVGVSKEDVKTVFPGGKELLLCGCAGGIPFDTSISRSRLFTDKGVYCYNTVAHELGHQLGLYHVNAIGNEAGSCLGPNKADCNEKNKKSDIMGYAWPQDHFGPAAVNFMTSNVLKRFQGD
jgi:hypothetical protein